MRQMPGATVLYDDINRSESNDGVAMLLNRKHKAVSTQSLGAILGSWQSAKVIDCPWIIPGPALSA